jgi:hypothetical protein
VTRSVTVHSSNVELRLRVVESRSQLTEIGAKDEEIIREETRPWSCYLRDDQSRKNERFFFCLRNHDTGGSHVALILLIPLNHAKSQLAPAVTHFLCNVM